MRSGVSAVINNKYVQSQSLSFFANNILDSLLSVWKDWNRDFNFFIQVLLIIGFFVSIVSFKFKDNRNKTSIYLFISTIIWVGILLLIQRVIPFNRVWLFLICLYFIIASDGIIYILDSLLNLKYKYFYLFFLSVLLISILFFNVFYSNSVYYSNRTGTFRNVKEITVFLKNNIEKK